mgnify:CR=1 FL=1
MSSDPNTKLGQAYELYEIGRPLPAERIAKEALDIFIEQKDKLGESEANFFLGVFYKYKSGWKNVPEQEYIDKAIEKLKLAETGYKSIGENIQASKVTFELGQSYRSKNRIDLTCKYYEESLELYKTGQGQYKEFRFNPEYNSPIDLINAHVEHVCAKKT